MDILISEGLKQHLRMPSFTNEKSTGIPRICGKASLLRLMVIQIEKEVYNG
jgi:hypothetical protein